MSQKMPESVFSTENQADIAKAIVEFFHGPGAIEDSYDDTDQLEPREEAKDEVAEMFAELSLQVASGTLGCEDRRMIQYAFLAQRLNRLINAIGGRQVVREALAKVEAAELKPAA